MFDDVLSIKEAFLEYKDVSFSKSRKSVPMKQMKSFEGMRAGVDINANFAFKFVYR